MAKIYASVLAAVLFLGAFEAMAADGDVRTCALTKGIECSSDEGCQEAPIQEMSLPRFVRIDLKSKVITSLDKEVKRTTKIATSDRLNGLVIMHGTELRGWSIALGEESGNLTLTAAGDGEGFVVFGSCIAP